MPGTIVLMFVLIVLFRQLIPRLVAARNPEMVLIYMFPVFRLCCALDEALCPADDRGAELLSQLGRRDRSGEGRGNEGNEEEIQAFIDAGQEEGILEDEKER